ncbi:MAG: sarcosine oxidase subunit delta [Pseudomonadota bacterium]
MRIICPICGERDSREFTYKGDASAVRPALDSDDMDAHKAYVYRRTNPAGTHRELWLHTGGCRTHVIVTRDTVTHQITKCEPVGPFAEQLKGVVK